LKRTVVGLPPAFNHNYLVYNGEFLGVLGLVSLTAKGENVIDAKFIFGSSANAARDWLNANITSCQKQIIWKGVVIGILFGAAVLTLYR
jgi:hypothetical protein